MELLFLILHYESSDIKEPIFAVDKVLKNDPSKKEIQKEVSLNIHKLLERDQMKPSLYNLIIGLNIVKTRKFLEIKNLQNPSLQLINTHDFDCSPKVRDKIDDYLRKLEQGIQPYIDDEKELFQLQPFLPTDGKGVIDYTLLRDFYENGLSGRKLNFKTNKDNAIKFILNLGNAFLQTFRDLLTEGTETEELEKTQLFSPQIFGQDLARMDVFLKKLEKNHTILPKIPTSRCISIKRAIAGAIESEAEAVHLIYEITDTMKAIGKRLVYILQNSTPSGEEDAEEIISYFSYNETNYLIPGENCVLNAKSYLKGKIIREALFMAAGISYQTGAFIEKYNPPL